MIIAESQCIYSIMSWASVYLRNVAKMGADPTHIAVVFDIDETIYFPCPCQHQSPPHVLHQLYKEAIGYGFQVFFITARVHSDVNRQQTWALLKNLGFDKFKGLFLMPQEYLQYPNASSFKLLLRDEIRKEGMEIVLNVGNRWQDLLLLPPFEIDESAHEKRKNYLMLQSNTFWIMTLPDIAWVSIKFPTHGCTPWQE